MLLSGKIKTIIDTGSPSFTICGQATSNLSLTNVAFNLAISKGSSATTTLINTADLSTLNTAGLPYATINYGDYDIRFNNFQLNLAVSLFQLDINIYIAGTSNIVTWEKFNLFITTSKSGYQPYTNAFELYNYDVGNTVGESVTNTSGNQDFNIVLINQTNNLDTFGRQIRTAANALVLRRPFTDKLYFYNMIASEGTITYSQGGLQVGSGNSGNIVNGLDTTITQLITLNNGNFCSQDNLAYAKVWFPKFISSIASPSSCDTICVNNLVNTNITYYRDASTTSSFSINGTKYFLTQFMIDILLINIYDYQSNIINTNSGVILTDLDLATWTSSPSTFLTPVVYSFIPSAIGDNVIQIINSFSQNRLNTTTLGTFYQCTNNYDLPTCNWWTVLPGEDCSTYIVSNCSSQSLVAVLQQMNSDGTITNVSTNTITALSDLTYTFSVDAIYILQVTSSVTGNPVTQYYTLPVFCNIEACYLYFLNKVLCGKPIDDCSTLDSYNFNAFLINSQSMFLLLNQEVNYNFIYNTIDSNKLADLYTIQTFIDKIADFCGASDSPCIPCNQ